jgi:hypothetical protein
VKPFGTLLRRSDLLFLVAGVVFVVFVVVGALRDYSKAEQKSAVIRQVAETKRLGGDLVRSTNSAYLISIYPELKDALNKLLAAPAGVSGVRVADEPIGKHQFATHLFLTNEVGDGLAIRLKRGESNKLEALAHWKPDK